MKLSILSLLLCLFLVDLTISLDKQVDCKCRIQSTKRIVGGRKADPMSYVWQVSLQRIPHSELVREDDKIRLHFCGGIIISEVWVLTAAHCFNELPKWGFRVGYGNHDLVAIYDQNNYAEVEKYIKHPEHKKFNSTHGRNDIALVKLVRPLKFNETVQPACLPDHRQDYDNVHDVLTITGYGRTNNFERSRYLREANTYDYSKDLWKCKIKTEICVVNLEEESGSCKGDSGGPLHYTEKGRSTVIGVNSQFLFETFGQCPTSYPSIFTRVSEYMPWIKNETAGDGLCV